MRFMKIDIEQSECIHIHLVSFLKNLIDFHPGDCKRKIENVRMRERQLTLFIDYFLLQFSFSRDVLNELMDGEMDSRVEWVELSHVGCK